MPYDNDSNWHGQFRAKIIVGILGNIRLFSHGLKIDAQFFMVLYAFMPGCEF